MTGKHSGTNLHRNTVLSFFILENVFNPFLDLKLHLNTHSDRQSWDTYAKSLPFIQLCAAVHEKIAKIFNNAQCQNPIINPGFRTKCNHLFLSELCTKLHKIRWIRQELFHASGFEFSVSILLCSKLFFFLLLSHLTSVMQFDFEFETNSFSFWNGKLCILGRNCGIYTYQCSFWGIFIILSLHGFYFLSFSS